MHTRSKQTHQNPFTFIQFRNKLFRSIPTCWCENLESPNDKKQSSKMIHLLKIAFYEFPHGKTKQNYHIFPLHTSFNTIL